MIKANELRIGNYVNVPRKEQSPFRVDYFDNVKVYQDNGTYECPPFGEIPMHPLTWDLADIEGIPLTPEILEKCGFKKQNNGWNKNKKSEYDENYFGLFDHNYCSGKLDLKYNVGNGPIPSIKFLHQLQNLYFAISGQELEVNL